MISIITTVVMNITPKMAKKCLINFWNLPLFDRATTVVNLKTTTEFWLWNVEGELSLVYHKKL